MNPLYNPQEGRPRAGLRLAIQLFLTWIGMGLANAAGLVALVVVLLLVRWIPFSLLGDGPRLSLALNQIAAESPILLWLVLLVATALILALYRLFARWLDRRPFEDYGMKINSVWWYDFGFGLLLGAAMFGLIFAVQLGLGWVAITATFANPSSSPLWILLGGGLLRFILVGVSEELLARGYMLRNLAEGLNLPHIGPRRAVLLAFFLSSLVFGLLHAGNPNATLLSTANLVLAGLFLGLAVVLTGSIALPIGLHITWNFFQGYIYGFPVSGGQAGVSIISLQQNGPDLWTGGAFGPEGGLIGVLTMLLGMGVVLLWVRYTRGSLALDTSLAFYRPRPQEEWDEEDDEVEDEEGEALLAPGEQPLS
jgi:uncharacterized protein